MDIGKWWVYSFVYKKGECDVEKKWWEEKRVKYWSKLWASLWTSQRFCHFSTLLFSSLHFFFLISGFFLFQNGPLDRWRLGALSTQKWSYTFGWCYSLKIISTHFLCRFFVEECITGLSKKKKKKILPMSRSVDTLPDYACVILLRVMTGKLFHPKLFHCSEYWSKSQVY